MLPGSLEPYAAIGVTILLVTAITAVMVVLAHAIGPKRHGPVKDSPYESGVPLVMDAQRRFNVRFLLVGMAIFFGLLVFGLLYEWKKGAFRWD